MSPTLRPDATSGASRFPNFMYQAARGRLLVPGSPFQERFSAVQALAGSIWVAATGAFGRNCSLP